MSDYKQYAWACTDTVESIKRLPAWPSRFTAFSVGAIGACASQEFKIGLVVLVPKQSTTHTALYEYDLD